MRQINYIAWRVQPLIVLEGANIHDTYHKYARCLYRHFRVDGM